MAAFLKPVPVKPKLRFNFMVVIMKKKMKGMKKLILLFSLLIIGVPNIFAQSIEAVLNQVEENNTTLAALRKKTDAEKIGNKTGIYPDNPEFEFHYLWGTPSAIGNRQDLSISQTFDFPTAYIYKNEISEINNNQAELEYIKQKKTVLLETRLVLYDLIYLNALIEELSTRNQHAKTIADSYNARFDAGDANILELNKAKINLLNIDKELETARVERMASLSTLKTLNGGEFINFTKSSFAPGTLPGSFEQWYSLAENNNPILNWLREEIEKSNQQIKLERAMSLPKLKGGYMSEKVMDEQFRGVALELTIPLWQDKNKVKYAKAKNEAAESELFNTKLRFYNHLEMLYIKATGLQKTVIEYRSELQQLDHTDLLVKALNAGEISLIDYIMELTIFYNGMNKILELERELNKTVAQLNQFS